MKNLILIAGCFLFLSPCLAGKALPEASLNVPCISGRVFFDLNHNNLVDPSTDYPMSGITVYLKDLNDQVLQTAITNDDGLYFFCDVPLNDDFILEEVVPSPNYPVSPASGSITITNYPYINGDPNFLNFGPTATIRVTKMNDVNGNGVIDEDDEHVPGITFNLFDQNNTLFLTATSDEDGLVSLFPIPSGTYTLKEVIPPRI